MSGPTFADPSRDDEALAKLLKSRRTIHAFQPQAVPREQVLEALDLACWVPNHHHTEPWRFYLLSQSAGVRVAELNAALVRASKGEAAAAAKFRRWQDMPGWLVVTCRSDPDPGREREDYAACCCAVQNLSLALWARGIGLKWGTGKVIRTPEFLALIGADATREFAVGLFWYGYPAAIPEQSRTPATQFTREVD